MTAFLLDDLLTRLMNPFVMTGIILAALGLAVIFLSKKIARAIRKNKDIAPNDNVYLICKVAGLIMVVVSLILMILE